MKCNCCKRSNKLLEFTYLAHIDNIIRGDAMMVNHCDHDGNPISGRLVVKNVCTECYNKIMTEAVKKFKSIEKENLIDNFVHEYHFLSNFHICKVPIVYAGMKANTVEHLYQACKTDDPEQKKLILNASTPAEAKRLGANVRKRKDWDMIKFEIMKDLVTLKFENNDDLQIKLYETGKAKLVEGNTWHDNTWGKCKCYKCDDIEGSNLLGKLLMEIRSHIEFSDDETFFMELGKE